MVVHGTVLASQLYDLSQLASWNTCLEPRAGATATGPTIKMNRKGNAKAHKAIKGNGLKTVPHSRGSIVRIKLQNFLTFDGVEIWPSSQLNVIVGPNGTGKSSIVCAICIGLGGATKLLGRAKEIREFVKHGKREGYVEIELCEDNGRNPVIRRRVSADDNSSTWYVNGALTKQADVTKLVENMNIQLQNKCVFLPQDMVVEFARMNMHQRLEETELAVGSKKMYAAHTELKSLRSSHTGEVTDLEEQKKSLKDEERKNQLIERDVERFQNRQRYEDEIKWIKLKKLWLEYDAARNEMNEKKGQRRDAANTVKQLKQSYQPIREKLKAQEDALKAFKDSEKTISIKRRQILRTVTELQEKLTTLGDKLDEPRQELDQAKKDEVERKHKIEKLQREIEGFRQELSALESHESIMPKIQAKNQRMSELKQEIDDTNYQLREMKEERERYNDIIRRNEDKLTKMQDVRSQRLRLLERSDRWAYQALCWLERNQELFKKPILEPVMVSVNILDQRFTSQVEAFLGGRDFLSFVAQTEEDRELFLREVRDKMKLKVNAVLAPSRSLSDYKPQIPVCTLRQYGFDKVMIELIQAPEPLLCYFCQYQSLHQVPIAGELSPAQIQTITDKLPNLRLFFVGLSRYSVTHSKYRSATSTRVGDVGAPRFLINSVDVQEKTALQQEIKAVMQSRTELDADYVALKNSDDAMRKDMNKLIQEKNALKKVSDQRRSYNGNIASRETRLQSLATTTFDLQQAEEKCCIAVDKIHRDRVKCFTTIEKTLKTAMELTTDFVGASLRVKTSEMRVNYLLQRYHSMKDSCEKAEQDLVRLEESEKQAKQKAHLLLQRARARSGVDSPADNQEVLDHFQGLPNTLDELLELMHDLQAKADMCEGIDPAVVHEYDKRKQEIEALQHAIKQKESNLLNREERISKLKEEWLGPLKELVAGISERFRQFFSNHTQMEAAGEVCLVESEDFSKFGIEIKVKFRDNERLQALNAQRQSGGERSVSTMLYLMALQGGSLCPFRVVDEINQGMDPVNERHVFNLIVKAAAQGAQYFLLTPKLLQNLEYSEAVQIHIVNNGQEAVDFSEFDLKNILA